MVKEVDSNYSSIKEYYYRKSIEFKLLLHKVLPQSFESYINCLNETDLCRVLYWNELFGPNAIKRIFFDKYKAYVHKEVVLFHRNIINKAPPLVKNKIKRVFLRYFSLNDIYRYFYVFFERNSIDVEQFQIEDIQDYSVGSGVYKLSALIHYQGRSSCICFFIKLSSHPYLENEPFFAHIFDRVTGSDKRRRPQMVHCLTHKKQSLLISPVIPGISSETFLTDIVKGLSCISLSSYDLLCSLYRKMICYSPLCDLLGRTDRHLSNSHIQLGQSLNSFYFDNHPSIEAVKTTLEETLLKALEEDLNANEVDMIPFDCQYLLEIENHQWIYEDICQGISELNIIYLLYSDFLVTDESSDKQLLLFIEEVISSYRRDQKNLFKFLPFMKQTIQKDYPSESSQERIRALNELFKMTFDDNHYKKILYHLLVDYRIRLVCKKMVQTLNPHDVPLSYWFILSSFESSYPSPSASTMMESFRGVRSLVHAPDHPSWSEVYGILCSFISQSDQQYLKKVHSLFNQQYERLVSTLFVR